MCKLSREVFDKIIQTPSSGIDVEVTMSAHDPDVGLIDLVLKTYNTSSDAVDEERINIGMVSELSDHPDIVALDVHWMIKNILEPVQSKELSPDQLWKSLQLLKIRMACSICVRFFFGRIACRFARIFSGRFRSFVWLPNKIEG